MNPTPDTPTAGDGFGPQQAAALLEQATHRARRQFEPSPPWLLVTRAVLVLAALGAIWLSVRGQHPYQGPTVADIPVLVAFIVLNFAATVAVRRRATAGVRGRSRLSQVEIAVLAAAWLVTAVVMAVLAAAGESYGLYPTTVLIIPGLAWAGLMGARAQWRGSGIGLAVAAVGGAGLLGGPATSWAVAAVGLCAVLLGNAAATAWRQRA